MWSLRRFRSSSAVEVVADAKRTAVVDRARSTESLSSGAAAADRSVVPVGGSRDGGQTRLQPVVLSRRGMRTACRDVHGNAEAPRLIVPGELSHQQQHHEHATPPALQLCPCPPKRASPAFVKVGGRKGSFRARGSGRGPSPLHGVSAEEVVEIASPMQPERHAQHLGEAHEDVSRERDNGLADRGGGGRAMPCAESTSTVTPRPAKDSSDGCRPAAAVAPALHAPSAAAAERVAVLPARNKYAVGGGGVANPFASPAAAEMEGGVVPTHASGGADKPGNKSKAKRFIYRFPLWEKRTRPTAAAASAASAASAAQTTPAGATAPGVCTVVMVGGVHGSLENLDGEITPADRCAGGTSGPVGARRAELDASPPTMQHQTPSPPLCPRPRRSGRKQRQPGRHGQVRVGSGSPRVHDPAAATTTATAAAVDSVGGSVVGGNSLGSGNGVACGGEVGQHVRRKREQQGRRARGRTQPLQGPLGPPLQSPQGSPRKRGAARVSPSANATSMSRAPMPGGRPRGTIGHQGALANTRGAGHTRKAPPPLALPHDPAEVVFSGLSLGSAGSSDRFGASPRSDVGAAEAGGQSPAARLQSNTELLSPRNGSQPEISRCGKVLYQSVMSPSLPFIWKKGEKIGQGTFGEVYMGLNQVTGELFGVKQVRIAPGAQLFGAGGGAQDQDDSHQRDDAVGALETEIAVMKELNHAHIVRYLGTQTGRLDDEGARLASHVFIFLEYVPGGSLRSMLKQFGKFAESVIRRYTRQILLGVEYLHSRGFIHRDIKGANVLVTEQGIAKLADFGCSKQLQGVNTASLDESLKAIRGSIPWMAPEVIRQTGASVKADIWSVGATVIEMFTGSHPWPGLPDNLSALFHVATANKPPDFPDDISTDLRLLLEQCFQLDPKDRPSAHDLLATPFLDQVRCACCCEDGPPPSQAKTQLRQSANF